MDKSWIEMPRNTMAYEEGVKRFIDFAFERSSIEGKIICPCPRCEFRKRQTRDEVYDHLICKQLPKGYTFWFDHGETMNNSPQNVPNSVEQTMVDEDPIQNMINGAFGVDMHHGEESNEDVPDGEGVIPDATQERHETRDFYDLARDGEQPLYEGCTKYSKLSFLVKLYHIKTLCGVTDKAMTMILELLHDAFEHAKIPSSFYAGTIIG
ncbi:uncharacterized protein LOC130742359 [Lotus japonicus]|uniref:uncharacterized protein LOC130742359 n=1 Tax=Lotus japonicus TaxID=34305 RepID=UPI0025875D76|nr:uncharacterized protein LOC130742359 [Lotus japonicus]XP_057450447.1 uncharacterized protein LOC130742359 [Lotus japonicus]